MLELLGGPLVENVAMALFDPDSPSPLDEESAPRWLEAELCRRDGVNLAPARDALDAEADLASAERWANRIPML